MQKKENVYNDEPQFWGPKIGQIKPIMDSYAVCHEQHRKASRTWSLNEIKIYS